MISTRSLPRHEQMLQDQYRMNATSANAGTLLLPLVTEGSDEGRKAADEVSAREDFGLGGVLQAVQLSV